MLITEGPSGGTSPGFYSIGGNLHADAPSYVERRADRELFDALQRGEFCYVLTSRQMGKSSLMVRTAVRLRQEGVRVAVLDLTGLGQNLTAEQWYEGLLGEIGRHLDMEDELDDFWEEHERLGPLHRWMRAVREVVLPNLGVQAFGRSGVQEGPTPEPERLNARTPEHPSRLVIFIDEIDTIRSLPFSTDEFFAAIRECYNRRSEDPLFNRLTFCLLGVATPSDLIQDTRMTPFNIGRRIDLDDFTAEEAAPLALGLAAEGEKGRRGEGERQALLARILYWTGGHPYLTQCLCQAVAHAHAGDPNPENQDPKTVVDRLCEELFLSHRAREQDDNLSFVRNRLLKSEADLASLLDLYAKVRSGARVAVDNTNPLMDFLRLAGITRTAGVRREASGVSPDGGRRRLGQRLSWPFAGASRLTPHACLQVRNRIYARVFNREWVTQHMPDAELRRQRAAYRRGLVRSASVAGAVTIVMVGLTLKAVDSAGKAEAATQVAQDTLYVTQLQKNRLEQLTAQLNKALAEKITEQERAEREKRLAQQARDQEQVQRVRAVAARTKAENERRRAERQRRFALAQRAEAVKQRERSRERLVKLNVTNGMRLAEGGDPLGALPWFAQALALDRGDRAREALDRIRLATTLRQCPKLVQIWFHGRPVNAASFSRDGRRVVTASGDGTARVWDAETGKAVSPPMKHSAGVGVAAFSRDGRRVVTTSGRAAQVWDAETGKPIGPALKHDGWVYDAAFSPDGRRVVTGVARSQARNGPWAGEARVWDASTGAPVTPPIEHKDDVRHVEFSPDGRHILTAMGNWSRLGEARIWDATTGQPVTSPMEHKGFGYRAMPFATFSPDGRRVVTVSNDLSARVWDAATGQPVSPLLKHHDIVRHAAFSPDGRRVVTASRDETARVWDAETGQPLTPPLKHSAIVWSVAFSPDGGRVLTASADKTVRVWDAATGEPVSPPLRHSGPVWSAEFSPDGRRILTAGRDPAARVWDLASADAVLSITHGSGVSSAVFSPDGRRLLTSGGDGIARVWNAATGQPVTLPMKHRDHINHAEFSPDGRRIATASGWALWMNGEARVWDAATGRPLSPPLQHGHNIEFATFSPDGQRLATVSCDGTARLWNGARGTPLTPIFQYSRDGDHWFNWPAFSRDGRRLFTASFDGTVRVWNVATGKPIRQILKRGAPVEAVWWSPDERRGVTYNSRPGWVELWDMATGKPIRQLIKPVSTNPRVTFSPDGRFVATAGDDNTVRVWLAATGEARTPPMKHGAYISSIAFSPDSRLLATACGDGTVRLWDTETGVAVTAPLKRRDVSQVAFSPDGHRLVAVCGGGIVQVWNMAADDQPALDAVRLAHLLSGHQIDDTAGFVPIAPEAARAAWAALRPKRPAEFTVASDQSLAWHLREAENLERSRQWPAAISYLTAVIAASPGPAGRAWAFLHARRAAAEGELGLWAEAASDGARAIALGVDDVRVWYRYALVQVRLGDSAGYRRTCATMLERFGGSPTAQEGIHVGMMCALAPNAVPDLTRPLEVAERLAANWVPYQEFRNNLGALLYRAGRFDDALRRLNEAAHQSYEYFDERAESGKAYNALFLAMCHDRLGHREEARRFLDRAVTWIDEATQRKPQIGEDTSIEAGAALPWWQRLELQILRAEAEGLIGSVRG